jgi:Transposase DDE domain
VLGLFDLATGLLLGQFDFASDRHESPMLRRLLDLGVIRPGDTLVFDRGFVSFANFCLLQQRGIHFVARLPKTLYAKGTRGRRRFVRAGGKGGGRVVWDKPARHAKGVGIRAWRRCAASLELRQVQVKVKTGRSRGAVVLITDLTGTARLTSASSVEPSSPKSAKRQLALWYHRRWQVETNFRHLKQTLNLEFFTSHSVLGVRRELLLRAIAYNLVRQVMLRAARGHRVACGRISFADAVQVLLHADVDLVLSLLHPMPDRARTARPRQLKYRGKNYSRLTKPAAPQRKVG